jgi:two-component system KDP operon response regulator KdpE
VTEHRSPRRTALVLGDDPRLGRLVKLALEPGHYDVRVTQSTSDALALAAENPPSLILLELRYRELDGVELCEQLRDLADVPVIFLSVDDDDASKVRALRCGDDYLTRPFSLVELRARADAVLRRARPCLEVKGQTYRDALLLIDLVEHRVSFAGADVDLTPTEYRILALLARYPRRVFLHEDLLSRIWGDGYRGEHHILRLHIANLRKKIEPDPAHPRYIKTHRGLGYSFSPASDPAAPPASADRKDGRVPTAPESP